jgi:hypothetical protein
MILNCEKCSLVWEGVGFTDKNGVPIPGMTYKCPKCGYWNGRKPILDKFRKLDPNAKFEDEY